MLKKLRKLLKHQSPSVGRWLKRYRARRTCR